MNTKELEKARVGVTADLELSNLNADEDNESQKSAPCINNPDNEFEQCCCRLMHIKRGTYIISYILAFFIITNLLMKIAGYSETAWDWELLFLVVDSIALASMFYGLYAEKAAFIQPFVVLSVSNLF